MTADESVRSALARRLPVIAAATVPEASPALRIGPPSDGIGESHVLRRARCFPMEPDGRFAEWWSDVPAMTQLEDLRRAGVADCLIVPAAFFAWLAERQGLSGHLSGRYRLLADDPGCRVFDLREPPFRYVVDALLPADEPVMSLVPGHAHLTLGSRPVWLVHSLAEIDAAHARGASHLIVPDAEPWAPTDTELIGAVENRYAKVATRPGICAMFEVNG